MLKINNKYLAIGADGLLKVDISDIAGKSIDPLLYQFRIELYDSRVRSTLYREKRESNDYKYIISYNGSQRINNTIIDGELYFLIDRYSLNYGEVFYSQYETVESEEFEDKEFVLACHGSLCLEVTDKGSSSGAKTDTLIIRGLAYQGKAPYIGENGNWWIGDEDTGQQSQGDALTFDMLTDEQKLELKGGKGDTGAAGLSAYEVAVANGYKGTEAEWVESLKLHLDDLTDEEIAILQSPATEAAEEWAETLQKYIALLDEDEEARATSESARVTAESSRVSAETARVSAESLRATAESSRVTAETARATSETARVSAESLRATSETARVSAESSRATAETARVSAESSRVTSETARVSAEESRVTAETARASAESLRVTAEESRETAESSRVSAEAERVELYNTVDTKIAGKLNVSDIAQGTGDATDVPMSQKAVGENYISNSSALMESLLAYGVQFDTTISAPECTRLGNSTLHKTLPIHNNMRGCLLADDGSVNEYLPSGSWEDSARDGSAGQVMVEIPEHYRKFVTDGTIRQVWVSEYPIDGYSKVDKMYVSAYEASVNRTTTTLASVANSTADYRGGDNNTSYDDTYRSLLGRAASNISLTNFRAYARKRNTSTTEWNCMTYEAQKTIFWLFATEYGTLNSQSAINAELTSEGYKQGGLGDGPTTWTSTNWNIFNGIKPFIPCGHTDSLGNGTGQVLYEVYDENNDVTLSTYANRYRGIENPFGHLWQWTDGIFVDIRTDDYGGEWQGMTRVFVAEDPANFASPSTLADNYDGYEFRGLQARTSNSYIKEVIFGNYGDIIGGVVGGSSSTFFCDYNYTTTSSSSIRGVEFGGLASHESYAGLASSISSDYSSYTHTKVGSRLCFHPLQ